MLYGALSCPIPAWPGGLCVCTVPLGPPRHFTAPRGHQDPPDSLCLVKNLQTAQGELLFLMSSDPYLHPAAFCAPKLGRAERDKDSSAVFLLPCEP